MVIPLHDETGHLVAYCGRSWDGTEPRYKFPPGFPKSQVLFNLHRAAVSGEPTGIVVEGFFDCLKCIKRASVPWWHSWGQPCTIASTGY